ncbi:MAG TPA: putative metallopeptidase [Candidatus Nanoarchaeia archaeon]|nr:putative metallopeptidase [Candidatus Nanoarchaeia archaeon]
MRYEPAPDLQIIADEMSRMLYPHVRIERMKCFRSYGSSSRGTIARCHALGKLMQRAIGVQAYYALEFIHERFDKLSEEEQLKVIIHELMHIPKTFGGGFKHHDFVCEKNINMHYKEYKKLKGQKEDDKEIVNDNKGWFGL